MRTILCIMLFCCSCSNLSDLELVNNYDSKSNKYNRAFEYYGEALQGSWRYSHPEEQFESLTDYIARKPVRPDESKNNIAIMPLGDFSETELKIIHECVVYLNSFYTINVVQLPIEKMPILPDSMHRIHDNNYQVNANYLLTNFLNCNKFPEAITLIALTNIDLYPSDDWNYVFGLASLQNRVGVWSINRFGNPSVDSSAYETCLLRTLKVASHEINHMFSIKHCVVYPCLMNGSNSLNETDEQPLVLCPDCMAKLGWNLNMDPKEHIKRMYDFWKHNGNQHQIDMYSALIQCSND